MGAAILGSFLCNQENPGLAVDLPSGSLKATLGPGTQHRAAAPEETGVQEG